MKDKLYIELLKRVLIDYHRFEYGEYKPLYWNGDGLKLKLVKAVDGILSKWNLVICRKIEYKKEFRDEGLDWPAYADTMIGLKRMDNIEFCIQRIIEDKIQGDFIETGVWRGGATIFMRALLRAYEVTDKIVWVADSFEGLPKPNHELYNADKGDKHYLKKELAVSLDIVKRNFEKYGLLDDKVKFLKGWFKDTLPTAPIQSLSLLRLDGDMYESTMDGLVNLYPKLSVGGYIIIDDWGAVPACKQAVSDYRNRHQILERIEEIDWGGVYWRKEK